MLALEPETLRSPSTRRSVMSPSEDRTVLRPAMSSLTVMATTSDGDISITLPENHGADLRLRGDDVRISRSLDFDGRIEDERATGEINGGGPLIEARTSDGEVTVRGN